SPFGGIKMSGIGRDGGDYSFDFYMETRNVCIAHDTHKLPVLGRPAEGCPAEGRPAEGRPAEGRPAEGIVA
ncbi:MAG: aldehyde dehydrogenase family protein, partial [Gammaproteobacteria bacterium]|nr:aldehyde dehydrogenase family protein [Gammaproteobacteria bacterium]